MRKDLAGKSVFHSVLNRKTKMAFHSQVRGQISIIFHFASKRKETPFEVTLPSALEMMAKAHCELIARLVRSVRR